MLNIDRRLSYPIIAAIAIAIAVLAPLAGGDAQAQFSNTLPGVYQLPQEDFTWTWGNRRNPRDFEDISVTGSDQGFRCNLEAKLGINSRLSRMDVREIENDLRSAMSFVQTVSYTMNDLDARRELAWAVLECERPRRRGREEDDDN